MWRLEGGVRGREMLVGIMASTENMTVGKINFLGGQRSSEFVHRGDKVVFFEEGNLAYRVPRDPALGRARSLRRMPDSGRHAPFVLQHVRRRGPGGVLRRTRLPARM